MAALFYTIGELANRAGLSQHTIRAWEKRYGAIEHIRTPKNHRAYDQAQLDRLMLLKRVTDLHHAIGKVANLSTEELSRIATKEESAEKRSIFHDQTSEYLAACLAAIESLHEAALLQLLRRGVAAYGMYQFLDQIAIPLLRSIGERWHSGSMQIYQEHMATSVLRVFLLEQLAAMNNGVNHPKIVVTTPKNQMHEIGAIMAAIGCAIAGWNVLYLGANLPSQDIADAVQKSRADALALSIVFPTDDPTLPDELQNLRKMVGANVPIYVGGAAANSYADSFQTIDFHQFEKWSDIVPWINAQSPIDGPSSASYSA